MIREVRRRLTFAQPQVSEDQTLDQTGRCQPSGERGYYRINLNHHRASAVPLLLTGPLGPLVSFPSLQSVTSVPTSSDASP